MNPFQNHSAEAEMSVIGSIMIDNRLIPRIAAKLEPEDFYIAALGQLFEAAVDASERGKAFDGVIAADILKTNLGESKAGKLASEIIDLTVTASNAFEYANIVRKYAGLRYLHESIETALVGDDPQSVAGDVISLCQEYLQGNRTKRIKTISEALLSMYSERQSKGNILRINTGFPRLDGILKGLCGGNLVVIAARPGVGKSALGLDIAKSAAQNGHRTLICSMEMSAEEISERLVSRDARLDMDKLIDGNLTAADWKAIGEVSDNTSRLPLEICDDPHLTPAIVRALSRTIPDLKLIIIDYLSLMQGSKKHEKRYLEIGEMTHSLKILAAELKIPIVVLSQLNRDKSEKQEPELRDLRESGDIEQDANKVILLWQLDESPAEGAPVRIGCRVAKNRRGKTGVVIMKFDGAHMRFIETSENYAPPKRGNKVLGNDH
ncbi:replicative DNA helicase [Sporobacter termitidis DSM 10068]|uniref:DNA 5'-3' helicase n=2 Tax=Sporobacter TaxID=44748 RepID=A0A1M5ZJT2_9FIRM|nr:replicative DNA helicase [Sporobacter termitidis DSM 10068]SHI24424.1 replicative DNA helicase [Sporobacter termitidis DSM 10068]